MSPIHPNRSISSSLSAGIPTPSSLDDFSTDAKLGPGAFIGDHPIQAYQELIQKGEAGSSGDLVTVQLSSPSTTFLNTSSSSNLSIGSHSSEETFSVALTSTYPTNQLPQENQELAFTSHHTKYISSPYDLMPSFPTSIDEPSYRRLRSRSSPELSSTQTPSYQIHNSSTYFNSRDGTTTDFSTPVFHTLPDPSSSKAYTYPRNKGKNKTDPEGGDTQTLADVMHAFTTERVECALSRTRHEDAGTSSSPNLPSSLRASNEKRPSGVRRSRSAFGMTFTDQRLGWSTPRTSGSSTPITSESSGGGASRESCSPQPYRVVGRPSLLSRIVSRSRTYTKQRVSRLKKMRSVLSNLSDSGSSAAAPNSIGEVFFNLVAT